MRNRWKGYLVDEEEGANKLVFSLREPRTCLARKEVIRVCIEPKCSNKDWDFEVHGSFLDKACSIIDRRGAVVAQVFSSITLVNNIHNSISSTDLMI